MIRPDFPAKVRGSAAFGTDLEAPDMLWAALVPSPIDHGTLRSVDFSQAQKVPGVVGTVGPEEARRLLPARKGTERSVFPHTILYRNQPVGAIAARTLAEARAAVARVGVEADPIPAVTDIEQVFPEWPRENAARSPRVVAHVLARHGDLAGAFRSADLVHAETYRTNAIQQVPLEPHACLAWMDGAKWHVATSTQSPFGTREDAAEILGIPESDLVVEGTWVGGGFGGKGAARLEPYALLLAAETRRPVKLALTYREEFLLGQSTLPAIVRIETSVKGGQMTARRVRLLLDSGASLPGRDFATGYAIGFLLGPYSIPAYEMEGYAVQTNKPPFGPHRAPFAPQCAFVADSHTDAIARRLGVDPVRFRLDHVWTEGDRTPLGQAVGPFALSDGLKRAAAAIATWRSDAPAGHGFGVGCGFWSTGGWAGGEARLKLTPTELTIEQGEWEIGNGSVVRGIARVAEKVTGLPAGRVRVVSQDTSRAPFDSGVWGSRTVASLGQAVEKASISLLSTLADRLGTRSTVSLETNGTGEIEAVAGRKKKAVRTLLTSAERHDGGLVAHGKHYGRVAKIDEGRVVEGGFSPYNDFTGSVHAAEVEVDRQTGSIRVVRYAAFQDAGTVVDEVGYRSQVEGGVVMGLGQALTEESIWVNGRLQNPGLLDYRIPTLGEVPPLTVEIIEGFAGAGPFGAKGVGEPPIIPVPATIANAFTDATGVRITEMPLTPERVARALKLL